MMAQVPEMHIFQAWVTHQIKADRLLDPIADHGEINLWILILNKTRSDKAREAGKLNNPDE
jgi:hypothetical protein